MMTIELTFGNLVITEDVNNRLEELGYDAETFAQEVSAATGNPDDDASVYVGTYAKYNGGSLKGAWIRFSAFDSYEDFINFCKAIHADEEEPELMFQDFQNFPYEFYSEFGISKSDFESIKTYEELKAAYDELAVTDYVEEFGKLDEDDFVSRYKGYYKSETDFAEELVNELYDIESMMGALAMYFDYDAFGRDLFLSGDYRYSANGYVFSSL